MTGAALDRSLLEGQPVATVAGYAAAWTHDEIRIRLTGFAAFVVCSSLLNKVRGALGHVLLMSASEATRARQSCDWAHTCAAEVFYGARPRVRVGDHDSELAKPYVLSAWADDHDLMICVRIFGRARAWSSTMADALTRALRSSVRWDQLARDLKDHPPGMANIADVQQYSVEVIRSDTVPVTAVGLVFATPISAARGDPSIDHDLIGSGMARRLALMAPWHGVAAASIYPALISSVAGLRLEAEGPTASEARRLNTSGHRYLNRSAYPPKLRLSGFGPDTLMVLQMAELTHVGRGATVGLGRFILRSEARAETRSEGVSS